MASKSDRKAAEGLKLLGAGTQILPAQPAVSTLETFANAHAARDYWIRFESLDFTSLCPITGQPDFAKLIIDYIPDKLCIETKSLKFYLASYRDTRSFNEEVVNRVMTDLVTACKPRQLFVHGEFAPRGGIRVSVEAGYPKCGARPGA